MALTPMTNEHGNLIGDLTVAVLPARTGRSRRARWDHHRRSHRQPGRPGERFVVFGSGVAERYYERWWDQNLRADGSVRYRTLGWEVCGLSIAGPNSRALLEKVTDTDVSATGMRFMAFSEANVGLGAGLARAGDLHR